MTRPKFSELRKIGAADETFAAADLECISREVENPPYLPSGRIAVIYDVARLKRFDRSLLGPVVLFNELEHNVDFENGGGEGFDEFLDHAKLLTTFGEIIDGGKGYTIRQILTLAAPTTVYSHSYTPEELLNTIHEDDIRYFARQGTTLNDIARRLKAGYYEDLLTTCCGNPGCGSHHAFIRDGKCDVLFEVSAGSLVSVEFFAFEIVG